MRSSHGINNNPVCVVASQHGHSERLISGTRDLPYSETLHAVADRSRYFYILRLYLHDFYYVLKGKKSIIRDLSTAGFLILVNDITIMVNDVLYQGEFFVPISQLCLITHTLIHRARHRYALTEIRCPGEKKIWLNHPSIIIKKCLFKIIYISKEILMCFSSLYYFLIFLLGFPRLQRQPAQQYSVQMTRYDHV